MPRPDTSTISHPQWDLSPSRIKTLFASISILSLFLCSCATTSFPVLGIRPDHEAFVPSDETTTWCNSAPSSQLKSQCTVYRTYHEYAANLSGSYRSRATLNEWALYFAGLVGLSGLTTSAGLAATNAGIQALRIVPLVTGFTSGVTAVAENKDKTFAYTKAANSIDDAISVANQHAIIGHYVAAYEVLTREVTKAKNELESTKSDLATRDKQIEKLVDEIRAKLPKQFRLSAEDLDIPKNTSQAIKVEDGFSVDPTKTTVTDRSIVDIAYSSNNQLITITGKTPGKTSVKFRTKDGISATLFVEVIELGLTPSLFANLVVAGGIVNIPNAAPAAPVIPAIVKGSKLAFRLPDDITPLGITSSQPETVSGTILEDQKWIVIEALKSTTAGAAQVTLGLKEKNGTMTFNVTVP